MNNRDDSWSVPIAVEEIGETGLHREIEAPAEVRAAIARVAGLRDLPRLRATFDLTRRGAGVHVAGLVSATVGQTCVVSLEPMQSEIEEPVDLTFAPPAKASEAGEPQAAAKPAKSAGEPGSEPPEPLIRGVVDLGVIATEFLLLGIDLYPRKPGAEFSPPKVEDAAENPFAALAALKKPPGSDPA